MAHIDLNEMTVIELRKLAKEWKVPLGAGISKAGIVEKLTPVMHAQDAETAAEEEVSTPAEVPEANEANVTEDAAADEEDAEDDQDTPEPPAQPAFRQAYTAPNRFNSKPAYQAPAYQRGNGPRPAPLQGEAPRTNTRPVGYAPRFGPAASVVPAAPAAPAAQPSAFDAPAPSFEEPRQEAARPAVPQAPARPAYGEGSRFQARPAYEAPARPQPAYEQRPAFEQRPAYEAPRQTGYERPRREAPSGESSPVYSANPTMNELIAPADMPECSGILELTGEGFGFLRGDTLLPAARDVYVSAAQVRRFGLRTGDRITGKMRPQRDGDKFPALLAVSTVNGQSADSAANRPDFDSLTAVYPRRRISLDSGSAQLADMKLMDLVAPIGFGQRGLVQCAARLAKVRLLSHLANVIRVNHPDAQVMAMLYNENPEDVTIFRDAVKCPVYATTFDMAPENHLKMTDLLVEHAMRQVELGRDVVLIVDSLTSLMKVPANAAQQGRVIPGAINPAALQKAKRIFGAARSLREGGSLTVIATMNTDAAAQAENSMVSEFRGAANMELALDASLARAGIYPPVSLAATGTRRSDLLVPPEHMEAIKLVRSLAGRIPADKALSDVLALLEKAPAGPELFQRIREWAAAQQA